MDAKTQIADAQKKILRGLIKWEEHISQLYSVYAKKCPDKKAFWLKISAEELSHAALLKSFMHQLDEGYVFMNIGSFQEEEMAEEVERIDATAMDSMKVGYGHREALAAALKIEASHMDVGFYESVDSTIPTFKKIAETLKRATAEHVERLRAELKDLK